MTTTTAEPQARLTALLEVAFSDSPKVDREAGLIRSVKILGRESRNNRTYSETALDQAAAIYEGLGVNIDHPDKHSVTGDRKFADGFGYLKNVRKQLDGVYGDLVYLRSHTLAEQVCEAAERMPRQLGLSHNAEGYVVTRDGKTIVEGIARIRSVDLVQNPATNRGLFESLETPTESPGAEFEKANDLEEKSAVPQEQESSDATRPPGEPREATENRTVWNSQTVEQLQEKVCQLETEREVHRLLESAGIASEPAKVKALMALDTTGERAALIATWPKQRFGTKPRSREPLFESRTRDKLPTDGKSFARAIR
jgi:hypothetical protein